jgi:AraC-like DNA-binding protein
MDSPTSEVRTDAVAPQDRVAFWEEFNAKTLFALRCSTVAESLDLVSRQREADGLRLRSIAGSPHVVDRTGPRLGGPHASTLLLSVLHRGSGFFHSATGTVSLRAGDAIAYPSDNAHVLGLDAGSALGIVEVPLERVREEWGWDPGPQATLLPSASLATLRGVLASSTPEPGDVAEATRAALRPRSASPRAGYLKALNALRVRLEDPDLTPASLAASQGLSERALYRLFAAQDQSPAQLILSERLDAAREALRRDPQLQIGEASARWGFSSSAHFARAFRRRFGASPTQDRLDTA